MAKTSGFSVLAILNAIGLAHPYSPIFFCPENVFMEANNVNHDQTAPEQSDLGLYCL